MNIFPVKFFRSLIEKRQMLNKKASIRTNIFFWQKAERQRKKTRNNKIIKLTERKDKTIHKDFDLKRAKKESYTFRRKNKKNDN